MALHDLIGVIGIGLIMLAYLMIQLRLLDVRSYIYLNMNLAGSLALLFSLYHEWNTGGVVINLFWACISIYGLFKRKQRDAI